MPANFLLFRALRIFGSLYCLSRDLNLRASASARHHFDSAAALVPCAEIVARIGAGGITPQFLVDDIKRLEEVREVDVRQSSQAVETICDGQGLGGFAVMFRPKQFQKRGAELRLDPLLSGNESRFFVLQLFGETYGEIGLERTGPGRKLRKHVFQIAATGARRGGQAVCPQLRGLADLLLAADAFGQTGESFNERKT